MNQKDNFISLNGEWDYRIKCEDGELSGKILVPFPVESHSSGVEYSKKIYKLIYKKKIMLEKQNNRHIVIFFDAIDYESTIRVNGLNAGYHRGGYSSFSCDITNLVENGKETEIEVEVTDNTDNTNQARGKQSIDSKPHGCFYTRVTGIWQDVYIKILPETFIKSVVIDSFNLNGDVTFTLSFNKISDDVVMITISRDTKIITKGVFKTGTKDISISLHVDSPLLWTSDEPNLYRYDISIEGQTLSGNLGFRTVSYDLHGFYINSEKTPLCMVLDQGYYKNGIYTPESEQDFINDITKAKKLGFNGARLHQKVFPEKYLELADKMGFLVFGEFPSWGLDNKNPETIYSIIDEWMDALNIFRSHPSVIGYCPLNETEKGQSNDFVLGLYKITKQIDQTRPVIDTSGFRHVKTDIYDIHDYEQSAEILEKRYKATAGILPYDEYGNSYDGKVPLFMSEFGGTFYNPEFFPEGLFPGQDDVWNKWKSPKNEDEIIDRITSLILAMKEHHFIGFCYTQLYDVEQEINGLFTYDRNKKFSDESYERIHKAIEEYKEAVKGI